METAGEPWRCVALGTVKLKRRLFHPRSASKINRKSLILDVFTGRVIFRRAAKPAKVGCDFGGISIATSCGEGCSTRY